MGQMVVTVNADERESVWHLDTSQGQSAAQIWPTRNLAIEWADGTTEILPRRKRCLTNPGGSAQVDITSLDYYVAAYRGGIAAGVLPSIVPVTALSTLDTLFADKEWGLLRVFGRWGSRDPLVGGGAGSGLPMPQLRGSLLYVPLDGSPAEWLQPAKGDIVRGNQDEVGPYWERYGIDQGNQGDVLMNDRDHSGLAIWQPYSGIIPVPSNIIAVSDGLTKTLISNTVPAGWLDLSYDDSAWSAAAVAITDGQTLPPSSNAIWHTPLPVSNPEQCLFRRVFTLPTDSVISATLSLARDDGTTGIWLNGNLIPASVWPWMGPPGFGPRDFTLDPAWFIPDGGNILAIQANTSVPIHAWIAYTLSVS